MFRYKSLTQSFCLFSNTFVFIFMPEIKYKWKTTKNDKIDDKFENF